MIRVLQIVTGLSGGGVGSAVMNYYVNMPEEFVFDFAVNESKGGFFEDIVTERGGQIFEVPPLQYGIREYFTSLISTLRMSKGSILHCNMGEKSLFFLFFGFLLGYKKRILHIHSSIRPEGKIEKIERKILTFLCMLFATDYFACGEEAAKWFYGKRQNKVYIMRNAIDLNKYAFSQELRNHYRLKYCINDKTVYGNVGRLSPPKNHKFLLDVFDCLHKRDNKSCLLLVGTGELEQQVIEKINHLGLQDSVIMVGLCDKVYEILNCFDAFLMPSISEGVPVAAVEALANGLVVYCSSAVTKEIQVSNHVQYLSLDKSAEEWANVIATGDTTRKDVSNDLAKIGFDIKTQVGKLMKIYQLKES